jgi:20S proteasome alpha/beta subunit
VTLCIAAACFDGDAPKIVLCTDWKDEMEGIGSAETIDKLSFIRDGWVALVAGDAPDSEALVTLYRNQLGDVDLTRANFFDELKRPMHERKRILADDYTRQLLGINYEEVLQRGSETFGVEFVQQHLAEIKQLRLGASLILCGFLDGYDYVAKKIEKRPVIVVVEDSPKPQDNFTIQSDFAAIGSGSYAALAALYNREQEADFSLLETIYYLYEAKVLSEKVPGVGESVSIDVLHADGSVTSLSDDGYDKCDELFRRFGPRLVTDKTRLKFKMEPEFLEPFHKEHDEVEEKRLELSSKASKTIRCSRVRG